MPWDRGYYYRSRKVGGRVVPEYVGRGRVAQLAAQLDAIEREKREAAAAAWRAEKARFDALDADLAALIEVTDLAAAAALLAAGFHQHKRQWRRKRHGNADGTAGPDRPEGTGKDSAPRQQGAVDAAQLAAVEMWLHRARCLFHALRRIALAFKHEAVENSAVRRHRPRSASMQI